MSTAEEQKPVAEEQENKENTAVEQHDSDDQATEKDKKQNRGEKKFKKQMLKMGMKPITGINRVTIKRGKQMMLSINDPEVLKSQENSYVVFGEAKINDFAGQGGLGAQEPHTHDNFTPQQPSDNVQVVKDEAQKTEEMNPESEEGLDAEAIKSVMDHCKVSKIEAIKALRASDNDPINAILALSN